ncbi:PTS system mannose/fructose/sorbose family transporter subunit IID [Mollicutes bacterium LVI A0039]|nr:PTS system mannose/fructose/sorbose family transporter subunit IID [Mollicutes bacterium LVI A0039]
MNTTNNKLSEQDIRKLSIRWMALSQVSWSYNKMMAPGYFAATYPTLKKIYKDDPEGLRESINTSLIFFNSNPHTSHAILGMTIGMEEVKKQEVLETVAGLKTGLMGPFAGIGDSVFGVIIPTIMGSIAAYMAIDGNALGAILWIIANIIVIGVRMKLTLIGYNLGEKIVTMYSDILSKFTNSAMILGLIVVGGLIPTIVRANLNSEIMIGELPIDLQAMADSIMPGLIPVIFIVFGYKMLGMKNMTSTKLIFIIIILGIVLGLTNILV